MNTRSEMLRGIYEAARKLHASGNIDDVAMREFDELCQNSDIAINDNITESGCCVFHSIGLCTEDIVWNLAKKGKNIDAIRLLRDHGFSLKEAKNMFEGIVKKRFSQCRTIGSSSGS